MDGVEENPRHAGAPRALEVQQFAAARSSEVRALYGALKSRAEASAGGLASLSVPRHLRRRTASHNRRRPFLFNQKKQYKRPKSGVRGSTDCSQSGKNEASSSQLDSGAATIQSEDDRKRKAEKRPPCRRVRRRMELKRVREGEDFCHSDGTRRLATHVWHAKRFPMTKCWGYCLPKGLPGRGRGSRAVFKWVKEAAVLHDASYHGLIELQGTSDAIIQSLDWVLEPPVQPFSSASDYKKEESHGLLYGNAVVHEVGNVPHHAICPITFLWRPPLGKVQPEHMPSESFPAINVEERQLWIWVHPSAFDEAFQCLLAACERQGLSSGQKIVKCRSRRGEFARLELLGSKALEILQKVMHPASRKLESVRNKGSGGEALSGALNATFFAKAEGLPAAAVLGLDVYDPRDLSESCCLDDKGYPPDTAGEDAATGDESENILSGGKHVSDAECGSLDAEPDEGAFLSLVGTNKELDVRSQWWSLADRGLSREISDCPCLWDLETLGKKRWFPPLSEKKLSDKRYKKRLEVLSGVRKCTLTKGSEPDGVIEMACSGVCPVLLLKLTPLRSSASGWAIILPMTWVNAFWVPLVFAGGHVIGLRERRWLATDAEIASFPYDYPDCPAYGEQLAADLAVFDQDNSKRPLAKRIPHYLVSPLQISVMEAFNSNNSNKNGSISAQIIQPGTELEDSSNRCGVEDKTESFTSTPAVVGHNISPLRNVGENHPSYVNPLDPEVPEAKSVSVSEIDAQGTGGVEFLASIPTPSMKAQSEQACSLDCGVDQGRNEKRTTSALDTAGMVSLQSTDLDSDSLITEAGKITEDLSTPVVCPQEKSVSSYDQAGQGTVLTIPSLVTDMITESSGVSELVSTDLGSVRNNALIPVEGLYSPTGSSSMELGMPSHGVHDLSSIHEITLADNIAVTTNDTLVTELVDMECDTPINDGSLLSTMLCNLEEVASTLCAKEQCNVNKISSSITDDATVGIGVTQMVILDSDNVISESGRREEGLLFPAVARDLEEVVPTNCVVEQSSLINILPGSADSLVAAGSTGDNESSKMELETSLKDAGRLGEGISSPRVIHNSDELASSQCVLAQYEIDTVTHATDMIVSSTGVSEVMYRDCSTLISEAGTLMEGPLSSTVAFQVNPAVLSQHEVDQVTQEGSTTSDINIKTGETDVSEQKIMECDTSSCEANHLVVCASPAAAACQEELLDGEGDGMESCKTEANDTTAGELSGVGVTNMDTDIPIAGTKPSVASASSWPVACQVNQGFSSEETIPQSPGICKRNPDISTERIVGTDVCGSGGIEKEVCLSEELVHIVPTKPSLRSSGQVPYSGSVINAERKVLLFFVARTVESLVEAFRLSGLEKALLLCPMERTMGGIKDAFKRGELAWCASCSKWSDTGLSETVYAIKEGQKKVCYVRVLVLAPRKGVVEEGAVLFSPIKEDFESYLCRSKNWQGVNTCGVYQEEKKTRQKKKGKGNIVQNVTGSVISGPVKEDIGRGTNFTDTKDGGLCEAWSRRKSIGLITSSAPRGSKGLSTGICDAGALMKLRATQGADQRWWNRRDILLLAGNKYSTKLRPVLVSLALEQAEDIVW